MKKIWVVLLIVVASVAGTVVAIDLPGGNVYGPFSCNGCTVSSPMPDAATKGYIDGYAQWIRDNENFLFHYGADDLIIVCNESYCTTYEVTDSGGYLGKEREPIDPPPEDENDGGGGSWGGGPPPSGGGGPGGPSGCVAGCNPNVDVGDPEQTQP